MDYIKNALVIEKENVEFETITIQSAVDILHEVTFKSCRIFDSFIDRDVWSHNYYINCSFEGCIFSNITSDEIKHRNAVSYNNVFIYD